MNGYEFAFIVVGFLVIVILSCDIEITWNNKEETKPSEIEDIK